MGEGMMGDAIQVRGTGRGDRQCTGDCYPTRAFSRFGRIPSPTGPRLRGTPAKVVVSKFNKQRIASQDLANLSFDGFLMSAVTLVLLHTSMAVPNRGVAPTVFGLRIQNASIFVPAAMYIQTQDVCSYNIS